MTDKRYDDWLWGEAQAMYFSWARRFMQSDVFPKIVEVGQDKSDLEILSWLKSDEKDDSKYCCGDCGWCTPNEYKRCKGI